MFSCLTGSYSSSSAFITLLQTYTTIRGSCSTSISIRTLCMLFCEKNLESSFRLERAKWCINHRYLNCTGYQCVRLHSGN